MKYSKGDEVQILFGPQRSKVVKIAELGEGDWYYLDDGTMAQHENLKLVSDLEKDFFDNVIDMPKPFPKFEHKHQLRINGYYLEFTHKELKDLHLVLKGLLNE